MTDSFLKTKYHVPPLLPNLVERPRLYKHLDQSLQPGRKITVVAAPAGYGKTTALVQWARAFDHQVGWLSLDRSDDDFERFFRYLVLAWEEVEQKIRQSSLETLLSSMNPDKESVTTAFVNAGSDLDEHTVLILNDYHLVKDESIHKSMEFLIEHLPPKLHLILVSRSVPPLPLDLYRARGELLEVGVEELKFGLEETETLVNEKLGLGLSAGELESLQNGAEGWIVGMQLVSHAIKRGLTAKGNLKVSGRQRFLSGYLRQEILLDLPPVVRRFLMETSILDRLCGPLCEAVVGDGQGQAMLVWLEEEGLFISPLDDRRQWFRYHALFAEVLREELQRDHLGDVSQLHRRAARWYLEQEMFEPAFQHAVTGNDAQTVVQIAERRFELMMHTGQLNLLRRWLDMLPREWYTQYPVIGLAHIGWLGFTGAMEACLDQVDRLERDLTHSNREDRQWQLARVATVRCQIACSQNDLATAEPLAERALRDLPETDYHYRANIHHSLGEAYRHIGRWQKAREHYHQVLRLVDDDAFGPRTIHVYGALADVELLQGRLKDAARYWKSSLSLIEKRDSWGKVPMPLVGWVYIRQAEILYEWDELEKARNFISLGLQRAELGGDLQSLIAGYLIAGRLQLSGGNRLEAVEYLDQARPLVEKAHLEHWTGLFERLQLEIWLAQNRLRSAVNWSDKMLERDELSEGSLGKTTNLAVARVLIFKGDESAVQQALSLLHILSEKAAGEGRMAIQIEALALMAMAFWNRGDKAQALTNLNQALTLAEPEGYVRLFVDLGLPMARLLQLAATRSGMPAYVGQLLASFDSDWLEAEERPLPEPLTDRETEILQLIAAGLTNREIAGQLVISPETVKKHASSIYGKLDAKSRTEAAAIARELNLLD